MIEIQQLLNMAIQHDNLANECRKAAGGLLVESRLGKTDLEYLGFIKSMGIDSQTCELLIGMHSGGTEHG